MNIVTLQGRIVKTPELRQTNSGRFVGFTLAIYRNETTTDFIDCMAWDKTADLIIEHFKKGDKLLLTGSLNTFKKNEETKLNVSVNRIFF